MEHEVVRINSVDYLLVKVDKIHYTTEIMEQIIKFNEALPFRIIILPKGDV